MVPVVLGSAVAVFFCVSAAFFVSVLVALVVFSLFGVATFLGSATFFAVVFFVSDFDVGLLAFVSASSVGAPPALAFHPNRFNLPTIAFLDMPKRLPISDVERPLPVNDFNFFNAMLSQPLLILQNLYYSL